MRYTTIKIRSLHPDTNGGDHSHVEEFQHVLREHRINNKFCACGCGQRIDPSRLRHYPKTRFAGRFCANRHIANLRRKPRKLAVALALIAFTFGVQAQTNSAAFLAGMAQARANVIAATTLSPSDAINPMLAGLFLGSAPATNAVTGNPVTAPLPPGANFYTTDFIYPADMTNYSWTLQRSTDFKKTWVNWMTWSKGLKAGGTMTITSTNPSEFYRMAGN